MIHSRNSADAVRSKPYTHATNGLAWHLMVCEASKQLPTAARKELAEGLENSSAEFPPEQNEPSAI